MGNAALSLIRTFATASFLLLLGLTVPASSQAHPAHETNAEMVWNASTKSLEVALRMRGTDLEAALTVHGSKRVDLESTKGVDASIKKYLDRVFQVRLPNGKQVALEFAGKTVTAREAWLYFQFPLAIDSPFGCSITNRTLFGMLENQKNWVEFRAGRFHASFEFNQQNPRRQLVSPALPVPIGWEPPEKLESLPSVRGLPNVLTMTDGARVSTLEQWRARRDEIKQMIQYFEFGHLPPRPDTVVAEKRVLTKVNLAVDAIRESIRLSIGSTEQLRVNISLHRPLVDELPPVIIMPVHRIRELECIPMLMRAGYALIQYEREDLDPDEAAVIGPAQVAYPNSDWETLAVWAWGAMRVVDYLETRHDLDLDRIVITGHSRDGKAALLAGALDDRFAMVAPNGSGCGGAGCFRNTPATAETLSQITDPQRFGHWFHPRLRWFADREDRLPFDQHFVKSLVAPRPLLCTEARGDLWANPAGTRRTSVAVRDVYSFLSAPEKLGLSFRDGRHGHTLRDWQTLLEFAQWHLFGEEPADSSPFWQSP